ncbi:hypothetical protein FGO68_gene2021 [Halteria grandinella]|uniref:Uncharacterized protein n=1 Tax=Halteria grandinella TaxID=5974 RepID=A0A8J8T2U6_HALGN|nr:hypothetical protein FGO68_gene2021 [Halteria grandinella]
MPFDLSAIGGIACCLIALQISQALNFHTAASVIFFLKVALVALVLNRNLLCDCNRLKLILLDKLVQFIYLFTK